MTSVPSPSPDSPVPPARLVVVEDFPVVRDGLVQLFGSAPGLQVVGAVGDEKSAREIIRHQRPDVVALDLMLGGTNALPLIADLVREQPALKILVLSMLNEAVFAERALRAGAVGYVMKTADTAEIVQAVRSVLGGRVYLSPKIFVGVFRGLLQRAPAGKLSGTAGLSDREVQVFQLIGSAIPNRQIAVQLGISVKTVEAHREHLKDKLGLPDSTALVSAAEQFVNSLVS